MRILVINAGSSSVRCKVFPYKGENGQEEIISGKASNVGTHTKSAPDVTWKQKHMNEERTGEISSPRDAAVEFLEIIAGSGIDIAAIGHRFVHGGELFKGTVQIDDAVLEKLKACFPLAPIHNPNSYSVIEECLAAYPDVPQYVVFDTAFHAQMPDEAKVYAIPPIVAEHFGLRKYGFHGLSYQYVSEKAAQILNKPLDSVKLIMCHLGSGGSSVCAFKDGHSVETSMGYSPLAGLVMSTRSGDIDPEVALELVRKGFPPDKVSGFLNFESGLAGLSGYSSNLAEVIEAAESGNEKCRLAYEVYANRLMFYLGAYTWLLQGADAIVFTDDIGVSSWKLREKVCANRESLGLELDPDRNCNYSPGSAPDVGLPGSRTRILVIPTDEEEVIFKEVVNCLAKPGC